MLSLSVDIWRPVVSGGSQSLTAQVQALFAGGKVGGMWDMGDMSTLLQDNHGTVPVTSVTQPVGMVLDKSLGLVPGAEFNVDPNMTSLLNYPVEGSPSIRELTVNGLHVIGANNDGAKMSLAGTAANVTYLVEADISLISGGVKLTADYIDPTVYQLAAGAGFTTIRFYCRNKAALYMVGFGPTEFYVRRLSVKPLPGNHATQPTAGSRPLYQVVGGYGCAQFDAADDALLFPAITFGGEFNTFVAGKVTSGTQGVHLWRTADVNGTWAKYKSGDATAPTGTGSGSPTYAVNGTELSPSQQGQLYTQINRVDCVVESIGVELTAETALQLSGFVGSLFTGNAHRVLMISRTLTAAEKLLCRQWCAEGNGATVV